MRLRTIAGVGLLLGAGLLSSCGGDGDSDGGAQAGAGANPPALGPCLDRPADLPRPPSAGLPCELFPPGFSR